MTFMLSGETNLKAVKKRFGWSKDSTVWGIYNQSNVYVLTLISLSLLFVFKSFTISSPVNLDFTAGQERCLKIAYLIHMN